MISCLNDSRYYFSKCTNTIVATIITVSNLVVMYSTRLLVIIQSRYITVSKKGSSSDSLLEALNIILYYLQMRHIKMQTCCNHDNYSALKHFYIEVFTVKICILED